MTTLSYHTPRARNALWIGGFLISFLIASSTVPLLFSWYWLMDRNFQWLLIPSAVHFFIAFVSLPLICIVWPFTGVRLLRKVFDQDHSTLLIVGWLAAGAFLIASYLLGDFVLHNPDVRWMVQDPWILLSLLPTPLASIAALWLVIVILGLLFRPGNQRASEPFLRSHLFRLYEDVCFAAPWITVFGFVTLGVLPKIKEIFNDFRIDGPPPFNILLRLSGSPVFPLLLTFLPFLLALLSLMYHLQSKVIADQPRALPKIFSRHFLGFTLGVATIATVLAEVGLWYLRRGEPRLTVQSTSRVLVPF